MAKRNSDGDVLSDRLSVFQANQRRMLASMLGSTSEDEQKEEQVRDELEDEDFYKESQAYEHIGIGGIIPKDVEDGSFTKRAVTSDNKLLEQLIGKKAAKAHLEAKQKAAQTQMASKPMPVQTATSRTGVPFRKAKPEVSDEEDEGRSAMFKSKRQKTEKKIVSKPNEDAENEDSAPQASSEPPEPPDADLKSPVRDDSDQDTRVPRSKAPTKKKASSYLDEILAERSKKTKKKKGGQVAS